LARRERTVEQGVYLRDYNYRTPSRLLQAQARVAPDGRGIRAEYGAHFKTEAEGSRLAHVRAEELACRRIEFTARSDCRGVHPGRTIEIEGHPRDALNTRYLVVEVAHEASQASPVAQDMTHMRSYRNQVVAVPP